MPAKSRSVTNVAFRAPSHRILEILSGKWPKTVNAGQVECTICQCNCEKGDICRLACAHMFHRACLIQWALEGENSCPNCKLLFREAALYREDKLVRSMCIEERRQGDGASSPKRISSSKQSANPARSTGSGTVPRHPASSSSTTEGPRAARSSAAHTDENGTGTKHPATSSSAVAARTSNKKNGNQPTSSPGDAAPGFRRPRSTSSSLEIAPHDTKDQPRRTKKQKIVDSDKDLDAPRCPRSRTRAESSAHENNVGDSRPHTATESDASESQRERVATEKKRKRLKVIEGGKKHLAWAKKDQQAFLRRMERQEAEKDAKAVVAQVEVPEWVDVTDNKVSVKLDGHGLENRGAAVLGNKFCQIFPQLSNVVAHDLLLGNNALSHEGVNRFLQAAPAWNMLSLVSNNMGDLELESVRPLLRYYTIRMVDLTDNRITTRGFKPMLLDRQVHTKWFIITRNKLQFVEQLLSAVEVNICLGTDTTLCQGPSKHCGAELHLIGAFEQPAHLENEDSPDAPDLNDDNDECYDDDFQLAEDRGKTEKDNMDKNANVKEEKKISPTSDDIQLNRNADGFEQVPQKPRPTNVRRQKELLTMGHRHRIAVDGDDNDEACNFQNLSSDALRETEKQDNCDKGWIGRLGRVAYTKAVDMRFETTLERSPPRTSKKAVVPVVVPKMHAASKVEKDDVPELKKMKPSRYAKIDNMLLQNILAKKRVPSEKMMELLRRAVEEFPDFETEAGTKAFLADPSRMQKFDRFLFQFVPPPPPEYNLKLYIKEYIRKWAERLGDLKPQEIARIQRDVINTVIRKFYTPSLSWDEFLADKQSVRQLVKYLSSELGQRAPGAQNDQTSPMPTLKSEDESDDDVVDDRDVKRLSPLRPVTPQRAKGGAKNKSPREKSSIPVPAEWRSPDRSHSASSSPEPVSPKEPPPICSSTLFHDPSPPRPATTARACRDHSSTTKRTPEPAYTLSSPVGPGDDAGYLSGDVCTSSPFVATSSKHSADRDRRCAYTLSRPSLERRPASPVLGSGYHQSSAIALSMAPPPGACTDAGALSGGTSADGGMSAEVTADGAPAAGARGLVNQDQGTAHAPSQVNPQKHAGSVPGQGSQQWDASNIMTQHAVLPPWVQQDPNSWMATVLQQQQQMQNLQEPWYPAVANALDPASIAPAMPQLATHGVPFPTPPALPLVPSAPPPPTPLPFQVSAEPQTLLPSSSAIPALRFQQSTFRDFI